ncbi:TetR/AcrR family transcriptional regulator [Desulfosporosinus fructosivorans]|nr:TetR/AcrR family transcriptional regulator [Desulfosporosinus fructosivorans]
MVKKNASSRILRAAETKKRIYESALALFKRDGFSASVDSIVEMAGVSKGSFYVHYKSKFSLIIDYVNNLDLGYADFFTSLPSDIKPSSMLILVTEKITDVIINDVGIDLIKLSYEAQITKTVNIDIQLSYNRKLYEIYNRIIMLGVQQGEFKATLDIASVSNHCIMSIRGMTFEWCIRFPDFNLKDEIAKHMDLLLSGIKNS